jgi:hypothetical protein
MLAYPIAAHAAVFFRKWNSHQAEFSHFLHDLIWVLSGTLKLFGPGCNLFASEITHLIPNHLLFFG